MSVLSKSPLLAELLRFLRQFWWVAVLTIPMVIVITAIHEASHALAVLAQGGKLLEFVVWPSDGRWGYIRYTFPANAVWSNAIVSLAPYVVWLVFSFVAVALARRHRALHPRAAALAFAWLFVMPVGDILNAAIPYLVWGRANDWASAFGPPSALPAALLVAVVVYGGVVGYRVQRGLLRDASLSAPAFTVLALAFVGAIMGYPLVL